MKTKYVLLLSTLMGSGAAFGALTNNAEHVDQDWSVNMEVLMDRTDGSLSNVVVGFVSQGTDIAPLPLVTNGVLEISMVGATNGRIQILTGSLNNYDFANALSYIVTTRLKVVQFPDTNPTGAGSTANQGIHIMDIRGIQRALVRLEADSIWVMNSAPGYQKAADIVTTAGVSYTWQFEVDQHQGLMDIFRRTADADPWTVVASNVVIRAQNAVDQFIMYSCFYNGANTQKQAILESEYLQIGDGDFAAAGPDVPAPTADYTTWDTLDFASNADLFLTHTNGSINQVGFNSGTGTGGLAPLPFGGKLLLTMEGTTGGKTHLSSAGLAHYEYAFSEKYNITTRMVVEQFPDTGSVAGNIGINIMDTRGMDRVYVHLEQDSIWVQDAGGAWVKAADIDTVEGTFYTWHFEVSQDPVGALGTVDIFRRTSDLDAFTTVATNVPIRNQPLPPQLHMYPLFYNATGATQAVVTVDYFQVGVPFTGSLYALWADGFGLTGANALQTADGDLDGMENLTEYALGGDPTVDDAAAILPTSGTISEGGTTWLEYVYNRRTDYVARSLDYTVETTALLTPSTWVNGGFTESGVGPIDVDFEAVTNRVDTGAGNEAFIRLLFQEN